MVSKVLKKVGRKGLKRVRYLGDDTTKNRIRTQERMEEIVHRSNH